MWHWLGRLKQADGGFRLCEGGEEDTRGAYSAMVILSLMSLPFKLPPEAPARQNGLKNFGDGLGDYLSRCQTYEGGISAAPGNEAHGAYTFCALACLCLLGDPHDTLNKFMDLPSLLSWLSSRQYAPEGGFAGRTNKLVDGCYCHWAGGCWPLIQAALNGPQNTPEASGSTRVGCLYSTEGHTRYVLSCCQAESGGLRDKPSK
jgi:protein farnesyltransferase subunit beta